MEPLSIPDVKDHLHIEGGDEDVYLDSLIIAARRSIEHRTGHVIAGDEPTLEDGDIELVKQAMLLLIGHWYLYREGDVTEPMQVGWLIAPLKLWNDGSCG